MNCALQNLFMQEQPYRLRFTCKEKIPQELKDEKDIPKGIVKWYVDVCDETGESVMIATILTMVRKKI